MIRQGKVPQIQFCIPPNFGDGQMTLTASINGRAWNRSTLLGTVDSFDALHSAIIHLALMWLVVNPKEGQVASAISSLTLPISRLATVVAAQGFAAADVASKAGRTRPRVPALATRATGLCPRCRYTT